MSGGGEQAAGAASMETTGNGGRPAVAWTGLVIGSALAALTVAAHSANRHLAVDQALPDLFQPFWLINASSAALFTATGWFLATRRPRVVFGWLALAAGVAHGLAGVGLELAVAATIGGHDLPGATLGLWLAAWAPLLEQPVLTAIYGLYPDGRRPRGWKRWTVLAAIALATAGVLNALLDPRPGRGATVASLTQLHNPLSLGFLASSADVEPVFFAPSAIAVIIVLIVRWRDASGDDRRVLSWIVAVGVPTTIAVPISVLALPPGIGVAVAQGSTSLEVLVIVAATLRHHVYGVDVVLNRALVYAALTAVVAVAYAVAIALASLAGFGSSNGPSLLAALFAALALLPLRARIQRAVNRLLYGQRDEPYAVVSQVASQLGAAGSAEQLLPGLAAATARALRVPYVAVELATSEGIEVIAHGPVASAVTRIPLVHQGQALGSLVVGKRAGQHELPSRERALLDDLAAQAAVAASNVMLTEDLRRSRERIVTAREEERRRLRNDLHDGLGPQLTGVALGLDLVAEDAVTDGPRAAATVEQLRAELGDAIAEVRRLVYGLRPPRLDEVGLCGALREVMARAERAGLTLHADFPEELVPLPAAVEVAVYRIVTEAVTNVVRHAGAHLCTVTLRADTGVSLRVTDDGVGYDGDRVGVGTTSMRERAEELGGHLAVRLGDQGGSVVETWLPVHRP